MTSIPPSDNTSPAQPNKPADPNSSTPPPPPAHARAGGGSMTDFLNSFSPEDSKKFHDLMVQNLSRAIQKDMKKHSEMMRKQKEEIEESQ